MSITVTRNFGPLDRMPLSDAGTMREIGLLAERMIRTRTERGVDVKGSAFTPLSAVYAEQKRKYLGNASANLVVSGRMLNDMGVLEVGQRAVTLGFRSAGGGSRGGTFIQRSRSMGAADKAYFHNEAGAGKSQVKREFFGLTSEEETKIEQELDAYLGRMLESNR